MKQWAVCYVTQDSPTVKWTVVKAANARVAADYVRSLNPLCNVCEVYKFVEEWRWRS